MPRDVLLDELKGILKEHVAASNKSFSALCQISSDGMREPQQGLVRVVAECLYRHVDVLRELYPEEGSLGFLYDLVRRVLKQQITSIEVAHVNDTPNALCMKLARKLRLALSLSGGRGPYNRKAQDAVLDGTCLDDLLDGEDVFASQSVAELELV